MLLNNNIILEIIRDQFWDELEAFCWQRIWNMEAADLAYDFDNDIDYAEMEEITSLSLEGYEEEEEDGVQYVDGILEVVAVATGYAYWDGDHIPVDGAEFLLGIGFAFELEEGRADNLDLENLY